jgi:hypothetical protein
VIVMITITLVKVVIVMITITLVKVVIVMITITLAKVHMVDITVITCMMITTTIGTDMCADSKATWREVKIDILI